MGEIRKGRGIWKSAGNPAPDLTDGRHVVARPHAPVECWVQDRPVTRYRSWMNLKGPYFDEDAANKACGIMTKRASPGMEYRMKIRVEGAQKFYLQARRGGEWMNLRDYDEEADAREALADKEAEAISGWEYRVV